MSDATQPYSASIPVRKGFNRWEQETVAASTPQDLIDKINDKIDAAIIRMAITGASMLVIAFLVYMNYAAITGDPNEIFHPFCIILVLCVVPFVMFIRAHNAYDDWDLQKYYIHTGKRLDMP